MHPSDPRSVLAERMRSLRKDAGLNQAGVAARLGWDRTKVSKLETGSQRPTTDDIKAWAGALNPGAIAELADLLADAEATHRTWRTRLRGGGAALQDDYDQRIHAATRMRAVSPLVIPGLLQTEPYARAILAQWDLPDLEAAVAARMRRRDILYTGRTFELLTTEAALRMPPAPPGVMRGQLDRLASLDLPNVTLAIIPLGVTLPVVPMNNFMLADDVATVESHGGEDTLGPRESAVYAQAFTKLMDVAATGTGARAIIAAAARDLRA